MAAINHGGTFYRLDECSQSVTAATFLVNAGVPIEIIKDFMGHRNISTTMIFAKVKTDTLKKAGLAFDQSRVSTKCPQEILIARPLKLEEKR